MATFDALRPNTSALEEVTKAARGYLTDLTPAIDRSILDAMKGLPSDYMSRVEVTKLAGSLLEPSIFDQIKGLTEWHKTLGAQVRSIVEENEATGSMLAKQVADYSRLTERAAGLYEAIKVPETDSYVRLVEHDFQATRDLLLRGSAISELVESVNRRNADNWTLIQQAIESVPRLSDIGWIHESSAFDAIEEQMRSLRELWDLDSRAALRGFDDLVGSIGNVAKVLRSSQITTLDGTLAVDGFEIHRSDLEQFLAGDEELHGLSLEKLHELVARQKDPRKRARYATVLLYLLNFILVPFLINLVSARVDRAWSEGAKEAKAVARTMRTAVERRASQAADDGVPHEILARYRIVTAGALAVRSRPTRDSQRLGSLHVGDVVLHISTTKRSWALIEWSPDDDDARVRGWVFSRYLTKLRLPSSTATEVPEDPEEAIEPAACH